MPLIDGDIKLYNSGTGGAIDTNSEITTLLFPSTVVNIAADIEKSIWVKNTSSDSSITYAKFYIVNGYTINNTYGTPVKSSNTQLWVNITPGVYSLIFPSSTSVVVTPPSGTPRAAQSIIVDGSTVNDVYLLDDCPIGLVFNTGLNTSNTATITISDGGTFIQSALYGESYSNKNSYDTGLDLGTITPGQAKQVILKQIIGNGVTSAGNTRKFIPVVLGI